MINWLMVVNVVTQKRRILKIRVWKIIMIFSISVLFYFLIHVWVSSGDCTNGTPQDMYESVLFQLEKESSSICRRHAHDILINLQHSSPWAVKMYDSGGKFPRGIITGVSHHAGNYYDCVEVEKIDNKGISYQGQYCFVHMEIFNIKSTNEALSHNPFANCSCIEDTCQKIKNSSQQMLLRNNNWIDPQEIYWETCIPSTCSHSNLEKAINKILDAVGSRNSLHVCATVKEVDCITQQNKMRTTYEDIFFLTIFCLIFICMASSVYDYWIVSNTNTGGGSQGILVTAFLGFSMKRNYGDLLIEPSKFDGMRILYGIRVISAILIIAFHRMLLTNFAPLVNPDFVISLRGKSAVMLFRSGEMAVDTFFTISAFLHIYSILRRQGNFSFLKHIFRRYMRLTPVAAFAIAAEIIMLDNMKGYPLWKHAKHLIQRPCISNWMSNMLYVSNFESVDDMCLVNAWYLGADMQLYVLSIPVILLVIKYPSTAKYVFATLTFVSIAVPFAVSFHSGSPPILLSIIDKNVHPLIRKHAEYMYWPTYCRAGAYIVGLIAGFLYHEIKMKKYKVSKILSWTSILFSFICCFGPLYHSASFQDIEYSYSAIESALFASTNRFLWGVGIGVLILNIATTAEGFLHSFLGHKYFIFLGKFTYSSLLANLVINVYFLGSGLQPIFLNISYYVTTIILDVFFTYLLGIFVYLIIEQPFRNLSELICNGFKVKRKIILQRQLKKANEVS